MAWIEKRKGRKCWVACWKINGKKHVESTGVPLKQAGTTPKQLEKLAQAVADAREDAAKGNSTMQAIQDSIRKAAAKAGIGGKMPSVREYLASFQEQAGESTARNRRRAFTVFLDYLGSNADMRLDMLTPDIMRGFFRNTLQQVRAGTVKLYRDNLAVAFNRAVDDEVLLRSPMPRRLSINKEAAAVNPELGRDKIKRLPFTAEELHTIFTRFPDPWRDMAAVSFYTGGQRLGDVCRLRWDAVDFTAGIISFNTQKTGHEINCQMLPQLRAVLERLRELQGGTQEQVFPNMARRYFLTKGSVSTEFTALVRAFGMEPPAPDTAAMKGRRKRVSQKTFHSLRHSFVTLARSDASLTPDMVRAVVGHDSEEIERGYFTADRKQQLHVLSAVAAAVGSAENKKVS